MKANSNVRQQKSALREFCLSDAGWGGSVHPIVIVPNAVCRDRLVWGWLTSFLRAQDAGHDCCRLALRLLYPRGRRTTVASGCLANGATAATGLHNGVRCIVRMVGVD